MIEVKHFSRTFNDLSIYQDINLNLEFGKSYALIGPSGSGKTVLLNAFARLEKPDKGELLINGKDIWQIREATYFKEYLGYVFQNYALIDNQTVKQNLKIVGKDHEITKVLNKVGIDKNTLNKKIFQLSGGQAQRVAIARMILKQPKIILADEPTGALDAATGDAIIELLLDMVSPQTILIIATHDSRVFNRVDEIIDVTGL